MNKKLFIILLCFFLLISTVLCGAEGTIKTKYTYNNVPAQNSALNETKPEATTAATTPVYDVQSKGDITIKLNSSKMIELSDDELSRLEKFETDKSNIISVDSGGRIDAIGKGSANITAVFSDCKKYQYSITVTDEEKSEYDGFSTCILANSDILEKNKSANKSKNLYSIKVNRKQNCVTVYTYDKNGNYTVPVRAMVCSCGIDNATITGNYSIYFHQKWNPLFNDVYGYYTSGIWGDFLFHSVPYYYPKDNTLEVDEYNKLGSEASMGCVRMAVADTKWIYKNCSIGTNVEIYDSDNAGPLGKPEPIKITDKSCGWDPTDSNKDNPYYKKMPEIIGAKNRTISLDSEFDIMEGISAKDTCSNDISDKITYTGRVVTSKSGKYKLTYSITDAMHRTATADVTITVE